MNEYDSSKMAEVLFHSHGFQKTEKLEEADVILLNTCSIREKAQEKVFSQLGQWRDYKKNISMQLFLDNIEISEIFKMFKKYTDLFIFKVPINYDFNYFIQNTKIIKYYIHAYSNIYKVIKFYYIFAPI